MNANLNVTCAVKCRKLLCKFTYQRELYKMILKSETVYSSLPKCSTSSLKGPGVLDAVKEVILYN